MNKGFSHGIGFQASYTYSHAIDDDSGLEDSGFNERGTTVTPGFTFLNKGDSNYDARHRLVIGYTWQSPSIGGDHRWLNLVAGGMAVQRHHYLPDRLPDYPDRFRFHLADLRRVHLLRVS